ncbi:MAG: succinate dehydrogenase/fumarate reductase iron-sulfur subunit [Deltaproteobacteria bacterium]|nr:succinate dehydrogenase/fumarate reductase iron-sulfur subunit [Deltaproteobacteria bacterium]MBW2339726.1 succinate dehydrogenase/fumarate reductase iron-sulfur subunit [Deltaproteobacteria bacterium]
MPESYNIILEISRYDPESHLSWIQTYQVEAGGILRFVDVLRKINDEQDPTLAWASSCEHAQCGSCGIIVNGKPLLACELLVKDAVEKFNGHTFKLKPLTIAPILRDLVVDLEKAYDKIHAVKPYLIKPAPPNPDGDEYRILPERVEKYVEATQCINCFCCATACISSHHHFIGPNATMANIVRLMDPRETAKEERMDILYREDGLYRCHTSKACSFVCPKEIDVSHFLALGKEGKF